jgi:hypothetical protein
MSKIPEVVTEKSLIDDLRRTTQTTDRIAYHINFWAASIFGIFNFYEKDFPGDARHNEIKKDLAEMVSTYAPLFNPVYATTTTSSDKTPMRPSEIMMICCGFESQQLNPFAYQPIPDEMQKTTSEIHRSHFKELIAKGKALVVKMSRNASFTSFMTGETTTGRYWSPVFNYAMFGTSVQTEHQTVGERFIELMGHFFITDEEQRVDNFGNYEVMTKLKIKHTLAALGIEAPMKMGGSSLRRKKRKSAKRGSSLRRKKRKSTKRRKS